jgi:hypothetical protein
VLTLGAIVAALLASPRPAAAQQAEPQFGELTRFLKRDYFSLGVLLQTVADVQAERTLAGENGFSVANFRLQVKGELDGRYGYLLQTNFVGSPSILDALMYYKPGSDWRLTVGQFKAPFSYEFLTSAASIDFVNRSQAVTALVPGRQLGLAAMVTPSAGAFGITAGVFNGNGTAPNGNDGDGVMVVGRFFGTVDVGGQADRVVVGLNAAYSDDDNASFGGGYVTGFTGHRTLLGGDVRATVGGVLLSGEVDYAVLDPELGTTQHPWGGQATVGYMVRDDTQLLARFDFFDPDLGLERRDWLVLGLNVWPTSVTEFQVNYIVDTRDTAFDHHQLLVNFQFGF